MSTSMQGVAIVDWCTATFELHETAVPCFLGELSRVVGYQLEASKLSRKQGFETGVVIRANVGLKLVELGTLNWGGESQRGRAMLDIPGASCGLIVDWPRFRDFLESLPESRLTRVDTAVDLHEGEFTVDDAVRWHGEGLFNCAGRNPSTRTDGDWLQEKEGRTLYIGKAKNGKGLRCYEKGKQLGDLESDWVRFEVQFGNRDRVLPFEIITDPTRYFVAAYPALEQIVSAAGERIKTLSNTAAVTLGRLLDAVKRTYGKWLNHFAEHGIEAQDLVDAVSVCAMPKRLQPAAVAGGVLAHTTKREFERWKQWQTLNG
jgi:phage replication initiation protein